MNPTPSSANGAALIKATDQALSTDTFGFTREVVDLVKTQIAKGASDDELRVFLLTCQRVGLDPFSRQIYLIARYDSKLGREIRTPQFSIDGFRSIAAKTGEHAGTDDASFDDDTKPHPDKATVTVYRMIGGVRCPFTASARWAEYVVLGKDGKPTKFWAQMPFGMLAKCAEALALRKAFPSELAGLYTTDEMGQAVSAKAEDESGPTPAAKTEATPPVEAPLVPKVVPPSERIQPKTKFDLELLIDAIRPNMDEMRGYMVKHYGTAIIENLSEKDAQALIRAFQAKYHDRIQPVAPVKPPTVAEDAAKFAPEALPHPTPAEPVAASVAPQSKRKWLDEVRDVTSEDEATTFIADMELAGEPAYKVKAARAIIDSRLNTSYGQPKEK